MKDDPPAQDDPAARPQVAGREAGGVKIFAAVDLFGPAREVAISHEGTFYRLKITRLGKLILTK